MNVVQSTIFFFSYYLLSVSTVSGVLGPCDFTVPSTCLCDAGTLICRGPQIAAFPPVTDPNIKVFDFEDCYMPEMPQIPYPQAEEILITNCHISRMSDDVFGKLTKLQVMTITGNNLMNLSRAMFDNLTNLIDLTLSENKLKKLPDRLLAGLPRLEKLDLSENNILLTDETFDGSAITEFRCHKCGLNQFPKSSLDKVINLQKLDLNANNFTSIQEDDFAQLGSLTELRLDMCSIERIHTQAFKSLTALRILDLGNNKLHDIPSWLIKFPSLKELHLEGNRYTHMSEDITEWNRLRVVKLGDNPWLCDCSLSWTLALKNITSDKDKMNCSLPKELKGRNVHSLDTKTLCEEHRSKAIVVGVAIPIIVICVSLIGYYLCQIWRGRQRQARQRRAFKYHSVYGETVESSSKQSVVS